MHHLQFHALQDFPLCHLLIFLRQTAAHHVQLRSIPFVFNKDRSFVRTICPKEIFLHLCMPLANCCCCLRFVEIPHKLPGIHLQQSAILIIPSQKVRLDTMDQTTKAKILHFERVHSRDRSSDQWRLMTRVPGLDIDIHSLPNTTSLLADITRDPAISRCRDEVIDRLSDIMRQRIGTFSAMMDWTAWYDSMTD